MAGTTRFLWCSVSLLTVLSQLVAVNAIEGLPTARIVSRVADVLNSRDYLRQKRQTPGPACIAVATKITNDNNFLFCNRIAQSFSNVTTITPSQAEEYCDHHCSQVLLNAYNEILAACGSSFVPEDIEDIKEFLYQSCNSSHGEYCLKEWVDPGSRIPSQTDRNYIQQCATAYKYSKDCPSSCHTALPIINRAFGCCYRAVVDYETAKHEEGSVIPLKLFTACGVSPPQLCHN